MVFLLEIEKGLLLDRQNDRPFQQAVFSTPQNKFCSNKHQSINKDVFDFTVILQNCLFLLQVPLFTLWFCVYLYFYNNTYLYSTSKAANLASCSKTFSYFRTPTQQVALDISILKVLLILIVVFYQCSNSVASRTCLKCPPKT